VAAGSAPYPPIGDYGIVGDLRSGALISRDGSVDWLCLPRFDSSWLFGRLLDWRTGGYFALRPRHEAVATRQYHTDSNVLETTWREGRRQLRVIDFMPVTATGPKPPDSLRLVRLVQPAQGTVDLRVVFRPTIDYGKQPSRVKQVGTSMLTAAAPGGQAALQFPSSFDVDEGDQGDEATVLRGSAAPGTPAVFCLHFAQKAALPAVVPYERALAWMEATDAFWRGWLQHCRYRGRFSEQVRRSVLVLKLMQYAPSGAFVAAPTTSLPERIGGSLNWDYRFTWLRDMAVLVNALHQFGFYREAQQFIDWLDDLCASGPDEMQLIYQVDGTEDVTEHLLEDLDGYRHSRPVRIGNAAFSQVQLDIYGEMFEAAYSAWRHTGRLQRATRRRLLGLIDHVIAHWENEDSGIWEARQRKRRYLYSQVMCWLALDRGLRMNRALRMGVKRQRAAATTRAAIKAAVLERGYNKRLGAFTQALDDDTLDATGLTVPLTGMIPARDPRVASTVRVLQEKLTAGGFLYRYAGDTSEFGQPEGAFLTCSFWLVDVLAQMGRQAEAEALFSRVSEAANDLGLFAEEFDPASQAMLGNFPQALTHLALLGAVQNLDPSRIRPFRQGRAPMHAWRRIDQPPKKR
jgi:GH15 family glucan-1,4-alpha-glucosidase